MRSSPQPFRSRGLPLLAFVIVTMASAWVAGCAPPAAPSPTADPREQAAAEATSIVLRAQSTALVLQAQAEATALILAANAAAVESTPGPASKATVSSPPATRPSVAAPASASSVAVTITSPAPATGEPENRATSKTPDAGAVELLRVEIGTESGLILVQFKAPPSLARKWQQGSVYVIDEATGSLYNEIPVAPVIGPLFARPKAVGQQGYVMFSNAPVALQPGSRVTVVLGDYRFEHLKVE